MVALWALSGPLGVVNLLWPRFFGVGLSKRLLGDKYDDANPRKTSSSKELEMKDTCGYVHRSNAAHQNGLEALLLWSVALMLGRTTGVPESNMNILAGWWLGARVAYNFAYIFGGRYDKKGASRTLCFVASMVPMGTLMVSAVNRT